MSVLRCRSCGCTTDQDGIDCPGALGRGGPCRCHGAGAVSPPSGGPRLPPNEVAPQLLANVRERGDDFGDLANATGDELRDALRLAARQLNAFHDQLRARAMESGPYMIGLWTDELNHVDPCDCDLDEENAGTNCMANSNWTYAVLVDGGAFAAQPLVKLPRRPPYRDDEVPDLTDLLTRVDPDPNAG